MEITQEEYEALHNRAEEAEDRYKGLTDELNIFFRNSDIKIEESPEFMFKKFVYVKLDIDMLDGKLKGFFEHLVKVRTQARPY